MNRALGFGIVAGMGTAMSTLAIGIPPAVAHDAELRSPSGHVHTYNDHRHVLVRDNACDTVVVRGEFTLQNLTKRYLQPPCGTQDDLITTTSPVIAMRKCEYTNSQWACTDWTSV